MVGNNFKELILIGVHVVNNLGNINLLDDIVLESLDVLHQTLIITQDSETHHWFPEAGLLLLPQLPCCLQSYLHLYHQFLKTWIQKRLVELRPEKEMDGLLVVVLVVLGNAFSQVLVEELSDKWNVRSHNNTRVQQHLKKHVK
jgi:hypothetical protein